MVTEVDELTVPVVTVKVAVVLPPATVTEAGTVAEALLLDRVTERPPVGAAALRVTVPVDDALPMTLVGLSETLESAAAGIRVSNAVLLTLL
jgi:hypothetical protein